MSRTMKRNTLKRVLSVFLAVALVVSLFPLSALPVHAAEDSMLTVRVLDSSEMPVEGVKLSVNAQQQEKLTDENGEIQIPELAIDEEFNYLAEKFGFADASGTAVIDDTWTLVIHMTSLEQVTVTGYVKSTSGRPLENANIKVTGYCEYSSTTDADGRFGIPDVYAGKSYEIAVSFAGYQDKIQALSVEGENLIELQPKGTEELSFAMTSVEVRYGETAINTASSINGNADSYFSADETVATVESNGTIHPVGIGKTTITAVREETASVLRSEASYELTVVKGQQAPLVWSNSVPTDITWKDSYSNTVIGGSGDGMVTYSTSNRMVAEVNAEGVLTINSPGTVTVTATKPGNGFYEDASAEYTLEIRKIQQEPIVFEQAYPDALFFGETLTNKATGGSLSGKPIEYASSDEKVVRVDENGKLTTLRSGTATITASIAGNDKYEDVSASYDITVYRADQVKEFLFTKGSGEITISYGDEFANPAYGGENAPIVYSSSDRSVATVGTDGEIHAVKAGTTVITATNPQDDRYNAKEITYTLIIEKATQTVNFAHDPVGIPALVYGDSYSNPAYAITKVTYESSDPDAVEVDRNGRLTIRKAGNVTITATAAETDAYAEASASYTLQVNRAEQSITFKNGTAPSVVFFDNDNQFSNAAESNAVKSGESDISVSYALTAGEEIVDAFEPESGEFKLIGVGTVAVEASFTENDRYNAGKASYTLTVQPAVQKIAFPNEYYQEVSGEEITSPVAAEVGSSYGTSAIVYEVVEDPDGIISEIDPKTGELQLSNNSGRATVRATKAADVFYDEATAEYVLEIVPANFSEKGYMIVGHKEDKNSEWFAGNVSLKAQTGYYVSLLRDTRSASWQSDLPDVVTKEGETELTFYVRNINSRRISSKITEKVKIDSVKPSAELVEGQSQIWDYILRIVGINMLTLKVRSDDATSGVASVEYHIESGTMEPLSEQELNDIEDWATYDDRSGIRVPENDSVVVYAKVTDAAGNVAYAGTKGIISDQKAPDIEIDFIGDPARMAENENEADLCAGGQSISIRANDGETACSGLKDLRYELYYDGKLVEQKTLFTFEVENPTFEDLVSAWPSVEGDGLVNVDAIDGKGSNVLVKVYASDNAGNHAEKTRSLCISPNAPKLTVSFVDDPESIYKDEETGISYYDAPRKAKLEITGMSGVFEKENVVISNALDEDDEDAAFTVSEWTLKEPDDEDAEATAEDAVYTAYVDFPGSAGYQLSIDYTDAVGHSLEETVRIEPFVVDNDDPTGTITVKETFWSELVETLSFHHWDTSMLKVTAEFDDETSPLHPAMYYLYEGETALTRETLEALPEESWIEWEEFKIAPDRRFTVYLKLEDYAGHVTYLSSDGFVIEHSLAGLTVTAESSPNSNGYYNSDVSVLIQAAEPEMNCSSGIQKVEYQIFAGSDAASAQKKDQGVLYYFNYDPEKDGLLTIFDQSGNTEEKIGALPYARLKQSWSGRIKISANKYNYDYVCVSVKVTDNAGNEANESLVLKINASKPGLSLSFDKNDPKRMDDVDDGGYLGYYDTPRTATVVITDRTSTFDIDSFYSRLVIKNKGETVPVTGDMVKFLGTQEGNTPDEAKHTFEIRFADDGIYQFEFSYQNKASMTCEYAKVRVKSGTSTPKYFAIDTTGPAAKLTVESNVWTQLLRTLTFRIFSKEAYTVSATAEDLVGPVVISYHVADSENAQLDEAALNRLPEYEWHNYVKPFSVAPDRVFSVYIRAVDGVGHKTYVNSNGYCADNTPPTIELQLPEPNQNGIYNHDINATVSVDDGNVSSGINTIEYWVYKDKLADENCTKHEVLYSFDDEKPAGTTVAFEDLRRELERKFVVDSKQNDSCSVWITVKATDNAGNEVSRTEKIDIDVTPPRIELTYDNNEPYKIVGERGYYPSARTATVRVYDRPHHFDETAATNAISVTGLDAKEKPIVDANGRQINFGQPDGEWTYISAAGCFENKIKFEESANYFVSVSYTNKADNHNENVEPVNCVTPFEFTVDTQKPTGTITAEDLTVSAAEPVTWASLIETLSFGLFSNKNVSFSSTADDAISGVESVFYYKAGAATAMKANALDKLDSNAWSKFGNFTVDADERLTVYLKIVDNAGNYSYISTNGIIVDATDPMVDSLAPRVILTPRMQPVNGIYNSNVTVDVSVVDPMGGNNTYSGIKNVSFTVTDMDKQTQYGSYTGFANSGAQSALCQSWASGPNPIVVDAGKNNSNNVKITVNAEDNAGNVGSAELTVKIDTSKPQIHVSYTDAGRADTTFADGTTGAYFNGNRTATISVRERNFDPSLVNLTLTNTDGPVPVLSGWSTSGGTGNGDDTLHTATLTYSADGDYNFDISCKDMADNANAAPTYNGIAPNKFTIDKTAPQISVSYDNNNARNGSYFNAPRTATVTITEHNFETSRITTILSAADHGAASTTPAISGWSNNGNTHTATISFAEDGVYHFDIEYRDKAGNAAGDYPGDSFCIDQTAPKVVISGISDESANGGKDDIGFTITVTDTNFDQFDPNLTITTLKDGKLESTKVDAGSFQTVGDGKQYTVPNLSDDGIYRITCTIMDKAGNSFDEVTLYRSNGTPYVEKRSGKDTLATFSVNRNGSTYEIDSNTNELTQNYYVQRVRNDIVIVEVNADELTEYVVSLNSKELSEGEDYTVKAEGGSGEWRKYTYTIRRDLFEAEGEYNLVVSSRDKAENNTFSDLKDTGIGFVVDRTAPIVTVSGLEPNARYLAEKQVVTLLPTDDGGALKSLIVQLVDDNGNVLKELVKLEGKELEKALEENDGKITFELEEGLYQNVRIICDDWADYGNEENVIFDTTIENVSVSSNSMMIFWANKPLRWTSIGGVGAAALLLLFLLTRKKRKEEVPA